MLSDKCMQFLRQVSKAATDLYTNPAIAKGDADASIGKTLADLNSVPTLRQSFGTAVRNNYLSALPTFIKNFVGNLGMSVAIPASRLASGRPLEATDMLVGYAKAFGKVFPRFGKGFSDKGIELDGRTAQQYDFYLRLPGQDPNKFLDFINKPLNAIVTLPQSIQRGSDEFFAVMFEQAQYEVLKSRAKRTSAIPDSYFAERGITRDEWINGIEEAARSGDASKQPLWKILDDAEPGVAAEIEYFQKFGTFRSPLGESMIDRGTKAMQGFVTKVPEFTLVLPFIITPTNIAKFGGGFIPGLGLLRMRQGYKDIKSLENVVSKAREKLGEAKGPKTVERLQRFIDKKEGEIRFKKDLNRDFIGQQILGTGLMLYSYDMVQQGKLTGDFSSNPEERTRQIAAGYTPHTIEIAGRKISYAGIEPLHTILALTANSWQMVQQGKLEGKELQDYALDTMKVVKAAFLDKTFTESLSNLMGAVEDENKIPALAVSLTNGLTPNALNWWARMEDGVARDVRDPEFVTWIANNFKARTPQSVANALGVEGRENVPVQYNVAGQPRALGSTAEIMTGFINRPAEQTLSQSFFNNPELKIKMPSRNVYGVDLTGQQYERMSYQMGQVTNTIAESLASNPGFQRLPDSFKAYMFTGMVNEARSNIRLTMLPELISDPAQRPKFIIEELNKRGVNPFAMGINVE
jgi:hypothetical protein